MSRRCRFLEKETQVLRQQYETLLRELNLVRKTPEGAMVKDYRRAKREKIDPIALTIKQLEKQQEMLAEICQFVQDFRDKKITFKDFLRGPRSFVQIQEELLEEYLEELFGVSIRSY